MRDSQRDHDSHRHRGEKRNGQERDHASNGGAGGQQHRAHAPEHLHDARAEDHHAQIYAETAAQVQARRGAFQTTWRLPCRAVADGLEREGGLWPQ